MSGKEPTSPHLQYQALMTNIRARYEVIDGLNLSVQSSFQEFETAAFHLRKVIEGVAFGCLVALENGLKDVPRDARGQWNAETIFQRLKRRDKLVFPESFRRRDPDPADTAKIQHHMEGSQPCNLDVAQVQDVYRRLHKWLHEWNPYVPVHAKDYEKRQGELLSDIQAVWDWLVMHMIGISGEVFLAFLKTHPDGEVRIVAASAEAAS